MESLSDHFFLKLEVAEKSLLFLQPDSKLSETKSTMNSSILILNEVKRKIAELKQAVKHWHNSMLNAKLLSKRIRQVCVDYRNLYDELPSNLPSKVRKTSKAIGSEIGKANIKVKMPSGSIETRCGSIQEDIKPIPLIPILTMQEFEGIPKYMKGRHQYEGINLSIIEINTALSDKYHFLRKGFQAMASINEKKKFKEMKALENRDTKGSYFIVMEDLRSAKSLKTEAQRRSIFAILRHCQRIKEIRGPGQVVRYATV